VSHRQVAPGALSACPLPPACRSPPSTSPTAAALSRAPSRCAPRTPSAPRRLRHRRQLHLGHHGREDVPHHRRGAHDQGRDRDGERQPHA